MSVMHHSLGQLTIVLLFWPQLLFVQLLQLLLLIDDHREDRLLLIAHLLQLSFVIIAWFLVGFPQVAHLQAPKLALLWGFLLPNCYDVKHLDVLRVHHLLQLLATTSLAALLQQTLLRELQLIFDLLILNVECFYLSLELKDNPLVRLHLPLLNFGWFFAFLLFICKIAHFVKILVVNLLHINLLCSLVLETLWMQWLWG